MVVVAKWITKNGHKVYLRKGGSKNIHDDYYRVEGKGVSGMYGEPLRLTDRKQALHIAKANVNMKNFRHDSLKHGFDATRKKKDTQRINELERNVTQLIKERTSILQNNEFAVGSGYDDHDTLKKKLSNKSGKALDRLDTINHQLPYLRTEIENLGGRI
jgi:hypothetical protein